MPVAGRMTMKTAISLVRRIHAERPFYDEETLLSCSGADDHSMPLDIFCFGHSLFRRGAEIHIVRQAWIVQFQLTGKTQILTRDEKILMEPGDLLISPPGVPYTFKVPQANDMTKYYMIFRPSPLLEILLGREIRQHGMKIKFQEPDAVKTLLEEIGALFERQGSGPRERLGIELYDLVCRIRSAVRMTSPEGGFFKKLDKCVNDLMNQQITLEKLSESFGVGKFTLIREFKKHTGMPPVAYMIRVRHEYAQQLLLMSDMTVSEIAACCGYSSASFFISDFRKHKGLTPGQFRARGTGGAPPPEEA